MSKKLETTVIMDCGHTADAITTENEVYCSHCFGDTIKAMKVREIPNAWRWAECMDCGMLAESKPMELVFFQYRPYEDTDRYACGCCPL